MAIPHVYRTFLCGECGCNNPEIVVLHLGPARDDGQRVLAHPFLERVRVKVPFVRDWRACEEDGTHVLCGGI